MVRFDSTWFGGVSINGKRYRDVLIVKGDIIDRENIIPGWFEGRSHHTIYKHELEKLLEGDPEIIIIGNGQDGVLRVPADVEEAIKKKGIQLIVLETPEAIEEYNRLAEKKKVNALIHTTC
jgi:hypothetical protein